jgi:heat shock protein HtpX
MNITIEAKDYGHQRSVNKRLTVFVMGAFVITLGLLGYGFDSLMNTVKEVQLVTVPIAIILVGSLLNNFVKGWMQRVSDPESWEYDYFRAMDWLIWTAFVICVWEVFVLGQQFFKTKVLLTLGETSPYGTIGGIVLGVGTAFSTLQWGAYSVLRSLEAQPADESNECDRQFIEAARELSVVAGIPTPELFVIADSSPNAFSVGRSPKHASIVVTQGLLDQLKPEELKGVVAHEISHIKNYDVRLRTAVTALFGSAILVSQWAVHATAVRTFPDISLPKVKGIKRLFLIVFSVMTLFIVPLIAYAVIMLTSRRREYIADISAASLTKNPDAIAHALSHITQSSERSTLLGHNIAHLCIIDPLDKRMNGKEGFLADLFGTHPPTAKRIELLHALAFQYTLPAGA